MEEECVPSGTQVESGVDFASRDEEDADFGQVDGYRVLVATERRGLCNDQEEVSKNLSAKELRGGEGIASLWVTKEPFVADSEESEKKVLQKLKMGMSMSMNPWLVGSASGVARQEGSFDSGLCPAVIDDLCSTTTTASTASTSYLSEPNSVLDLSRASMLFATMDNYHEFGHHLPDGGVHLKQHQHMSLFEMPPGHGLFNQDVMVTKERPPVKESGGVFRLRELETVGGFESPVNLVTPDVCPEWMDCLITDSQPDAEGNNSMTAKLLGSSDSMDLLR